MSRKKREIPVPDPEDDEEYICPSASWGDMTGLIPYAAGDKADRLAYEALYPYLPGHEGKSEEKE